MIRCSIGCLGAAKPDASQRPGPCGHAALQAHLGGVGGRLGLGGGRAHGAYGGLQEGRRRRMCRFFEAAEPKSAGGGCQWARPLRVLQPRPRARLRSVGPTLLTPAAFAADMAADAALLAAVVWVCSVLTVGTRPSAVACSLGVGPGTSVGSEPCRPWGGAWVGPDVMLPEPCTPHPFIHLCCVSGRLGLTGNGACGASGRLRRGRHRGNNQQGGGAHSRLPRRPAPHSSAGMRHTVLRAHGRGGGWGARTERQSGGVPAPSS
jgi:hypothetical protein